MSTAAALPLKTCPRCGSSFESDAAFCAKDGTPLGPEDAELPPDSDPYIGTVISGDIEILSVAGVGGMGRVYRAHQRGIERDVAVKILHRELSGNAQLMQRFHREAKIASKLQHPHVVEVYLAGQLPDRALYIVMEYLDGMSLAAALSAAGGVFHPARALSIALQICDAVGEGHTRGIVHRDLKPENVMLVCRAERGDWVKVLDFGIAKVNLGEQSMQTAVGLIFGTARYISPEGAQGATIGPASDVYSLATMIYQMLAGRTPFDAEPVGLLIKHIHEPAPPLTSWPRAVDIHPALAKVVMDNLVKDPALRAPNARAFAAALTRAAREANIAISEVGVIARLSNVDLGHPMSLEPTLDDAALARAAQLTPTSGAPFPAPPPATTLELAHTAASSPPPTSAPTSASPPTWTSPGRQSETDPELALPFGRKDRRSPVGLILLAFLLGVALAALGLQHLAKRRDAEHEALVGQTRAALADSRYVTPPGDCVRDLVVKGLARWPNDLDLLQMRSTASMELVTRAMVAQDGGDVGGARDLARNATLLDSTDHTAAILLGQYEEEVHAFGANASVSTGRPRVLFEAASVAQTGKRVELTARVAPGALGPRAKLTDVRMTLFGHSRTEAGIDIPITSTAGGIYTATLVAPAAGNYDLVFEASIEGPNLRAARELTVSPAP